jgi:hypothetical protein
MAGWLTEITRFYPLISGCVGHVMDAKEGQVEGERVPLGAENCILC